MNIKNLRKGQTIKNYRELCVLLEESVKSGASKRSQLKDFERYFSYTKDGNKFIINEIFEEVKPNFKCSNNSKYIHEIQDILIDYIYKNRNADNEVILSFSRMIKILGLVNNTYTVANYKKKELSEILKIELTAIYYFYNNTRCEFKNIVERALKNLQKRNVLEVDRVYMIVEKDNENNHVTRKANNEERSMIIDAKHGAMLYLGFCDMRELFLAGNKKFREFNDLVKKELPPKWTSYYPAYSLVYGNNSIVSEHQALEQRKVLNQKSIERLHKSLKVKKEKDNENQLINKLISLINYDFKLDEQLEELYEKHQDEYYSNLKQKEKEKINVELEIDRLKEDYVNRDVINIEDYLNYSTKVNRRNKILGIDKDIKSYIDSDDVPF